MSKSIRRVPGRQYIPEPGEGHMSFSPEQVTRFHEQKRQRLVQPSTEIAAGRLSLVYSLATEAEHEKGLAWYEDATAFCQYLTDTYPSVYSLEHAVGIVAALSPQLAWSDNLRRAEQLADTGQTYGKADRLRNATAILEGAHPKDILFLPNGQNHKVRAFYLNMANKGVDAVTVDRHGWSMLYWDREIGSILLRPTKKRYVWAEEVFRQVADDKGLKAFELQAVTWVVWRKKDIAKRIADRAMPRLFDLTL